MALILGGSTSLAAMASGYQIDRGEVKAETFFLSLGLFLSWFNLLKYLQFSTKARVRHARRR